MSSPSRESDPEEEWIEQYETDTWGKKESSTRKKAKVKTHWEKGVEFIRKDVPDGTGEWVDFAKGYGIDHKVQRYVGVDVRRKVQDVADGGYIGPHLPRMESHRTVKGIGEIGQIEGTSDSAYIYPTPEPNESYDGPVKFGDQVQFSIKDELVKVEGVVINITPSQFSIVNPYKTPLKKETYDIKYLQDYDYQIDADKKYNEGFDKVNINGKIYTTSDTRKWGDRVQYIEEREYIRFQHPKTAKLFGIVSGFSNSGFRIAGEDGVIYDVPYDKPVKVVPRRTYQKHIPFRPATISELLTSPVDDILRRIVRDHLFEAFGNVIPGLKRDDTDEHLEQLSQDDIEILRRGIRPWDRSEILVDKEHNTLVVKWKYNSETYSRSFHFPLNTESPKITFDVKWVQEDHGWVIEWHYGDKVYPVDFVKAFLDTSEKDYGVTWGGSSDQKVVSWLSHHKPREKSIKRFIVERTTGFDVKWIGGSEVKLVRNNKKNSLWIVKWTYNDKEMIVDAFDVSKYRFKKLDNTWDLSTAQKEVHFTKNGVEQHRTYNVPPKFQKMVEDEKIVRRTYNLPPELQNIKNDPNKIEDAAIAEAENFAANSYYNEQFRLWLYQQKYKEIEQSLPEDELKAEALQIVEAETSPRFIIQGLVGRYGEDLFDGTAYDLKEKIKRNAGGVHIIDVEIKNSLERKGRARLEELRGRDLASVLTLIIEGYKRKFPVKTDKIQRELKAKWIWDTFRAYTHTEEEILKFQAEHLSTLKNLYEEHLERYNQVVKKAAEIEEKYHQRKEKQEDLERRLSAFSSIYSSLTEKGYQTLVGTHTFEKDIFLLSGGETMIGYLTKAVQPLVFLEGDIGKYTKFFQSKLSSGQFQVSSLSAASLPHYFPELAMNFKSLSENKFADAIDEISRVTYERMVRILNLYLTVIETASRQRQHRQAHLLIFQWPEYIIPITEKCQEDTESGMRQKRIENMRVYSKKIVDGESVKVPVMEPIPLNDLVICYDPDNSKFSCHSIGDVMDHLHAGDDINPYTGKPYPKEFIKKMKTRYGKEYKREEGEVEEIIEEPVFSPDIEELFDVSDEDEEVVIEEPIEDDISLEDNLPKRLVVRVYASYKQDSRIRDDDWSKLEAKYPDSIFLQLDGKAAEEKFPMVSFRKLPIVIFATQHGEEITVDKTIKTSQLEKIEAEM